MTSRSSEESLFLGPDGAGTAHAVALLGEALMANAQWRRKRYEEEAPRPLEAPVANATRFALRELSHDLQRSVPYWSPRYVGHMAADPLLAATLAKMIAALYNQNNIADESAPCTAAREREVIAALQQMIGFGGTRACPWGHLTSGGSVANYEGLWHLRSARFYPVALARALADSTLPASVVAAGRPIVERSPWELLNLPLDAVLDHRTRILTAAQDEDAEVVRILTMAIARHRIEQLGTLRFHAALPGVEAPIILVPHTAHYSWVKAANLLGLGADQIVHVATDEHMRMRPDALADRVAEYPRAPIVAAIAVAGCTQFGALDPIDQILAVRDAARDGGRDFGLHVDAAWGGFLMTLLRDRHGRLRPLVEVQADTGGFPDPSGYRSLIAMAHADSLTIDPHKQGFVPFGAGAYLCRRAELAQLNASESSYVWGRSDGSATHVGTMMSRDLGRYSLEGSRSGESAASCSVAYRVAPLDANGLGRLVATSLRVTRRFVKLLGALEAGTIGCTLRPFVMPATNVVCLSAVPTGETSLRRVNALTRALSQLLKHRPSESGEGGFVASSTAIELASLTADARSLLVGEMGVDLVPNPDDDHVFLLRHSLMNPLLDGVENGVDPLAKYVQHLAGLCRALLVPQPVSPHNSLEELAHA